MLYVSNQVRQPLKVMVVRPYICEKDLPPHYLIELANHGIELIQNSHNIDQNSHIGTGCRVGLLILKDEKDLYFLDQCEPLLHTPSVSWIGLIAQDLISAPRVHEIIDEFLFNFITTPADLNHILLTIRHAWGMAFIRDLQNRPPPCHYSVESDILMLGKTTQMQRLFSDLKMIARVDTPLLITGPVGSGKELAALSIHRQSERKNAPFITFNCLDAEQSLRQTKALTDKRGSINARIKNAEGGTLFLSHIEALPAKAQQDLLLFLQKKKSTHGFDPIPSGLDVRIIAATESDLSNIVEEGGFSQDLYFCLSAVTISVPKLANRVLDIEDLARHFFNQFIVEHKKNLRGFSSAAMDKMRNYHWPENVQELMNRIQRAVILARGRFIQPDDLGLGTDFVDDVWPHRPITDSAHELN